MALVSANLLSKTPEIYGKSPDEDAERSFEHLIDVALTEAPAAVVRELARFAGTAVTMLAFRAGVKPLEFIEGMAAIVDPDRSLEAVPRVDPSSPSIFTEARSCPPST